MKHRRFVAIFAILTITLFFASLDTQACENRKGTGEWMYFECCAVNVSCYVSNADTTTYFGAEIKGEYPTGYMCNWCTPWCYDYAGTYVYYQWDWCNIA